MDEGKELSQAIIGECDWCCTGWATWKISEHGIAHCTCDNQPAPADPVVANDAFDAWFDGVRKLGNCSASA